MIVRTGAAPRVAGDSVRLRKLSAAPFASCRPTEASTKLPAAQNFGSVWGLKLAVMSVIYADYYGREHLGKIAAVDAMSGLAGTAVGPLVISIAHERFGSFRPVFFFLGAMPCIMAVLELCLLRKPPPPPKQDLYSGGRMK